jgi:hypothetical protein
MDDELEGADATAEEAARNLPGQIARLRASVASARGVLSGAERRNDDNQEGPPDTGA